MQIHGEGAIDPIDALLSPAFAASALVTSGLATITLLNYSMSMSLWSASGTSVTVSTVVALVALAVAYATNQPDLDDLGQLETVAAVGTFALVVAVSFVPLVRETILVNPMFALPVVAVQGAG